MHNDTVADRVLAAAGGMTSRRQLLNAGVEPTWLRRQLRAGTWAEPFPGVIDAVGESGQVFGRMKAALIAAGPDSYLSHHSAAAVMGLLALPAPSQPVHVTVPHGATRRRLPGVEVHQSRRKPDLALVEGVPVASPAATIADLALRLPLSDLRSLAADAVRGSLCAVDDIDAAGHPAPAARRVLNWIVEELWAGAASGPEMTIWRGFVDSDLPVPELNAEVHTDPTIRFVDGLWRRLRLGYEIDGRSVHAQAQAFEDDRIRQNAIQCRGILLLRFSARQVFSDLDRVLTVTETAMHQRADDLDISWAEVIRRGRQVRKAMSGAN